MLVGVPRPSAWPDTASGEVRITSVPQVFRGKVHSYDTSHTDAYYLANIKQVFNSCMLSGIPYSVFTQFFCAHFHTPTVAPPLERRLSVNPSLRLRGNRTRYHQVTVNGMTQQYSFMGKSSTSAFFSFSDQQVGKQGEKYHASRLQGFSN